MISLIGTSASRTKRAKWKTRLINHDGIRLGLPSKSAGDDLPLFLDIGTLVGDLSDAGDLTGAIVGVRPGTELEAGTGGADVGGGIDGGGLGGATGGEAIGGGLLAELSLPSSISLARNQRKEEKELPMELR